MVGKFLLGVVSGGLVVVGGLVVGSAVSPMRPGLDAAPELAEKPVTAPAATAVDAGAAADPASKDGAKDVAAAATAPEPAPAVAVPKADPVTAAAPPVAAPPVAASQPELALADGGPAAPAVDVGVLSDPVAPLPAEVVRPATALPPLKPVEATADSAAVTPDPVAPAPSPAPDTLMAEAGPLADAAVLPPALAAEEPAPVAEPTTVTPVPVMTPAPVPEGVAPDPSPDVALVEPLPKPAPETVPASAAESGPVTTPEAAPDAAPETQLAEATPETKVAPPAADIMPAPVLPDAAGSAGMPGVEPKALPGTEPQVMPGAAEAPASTFKPAPGLVRRGEGVIIGRGTEAPAGTAKIVPDPATVTPSTVTPGDSKTAPDDTRPLTRFAATFENPEGKPPMAVVLIDRGQADLDRAALAALPFPVSFALDPLDPATPGHAALYRAAGHEVVMLVTGIASGAQASDVEVAFQSMDLGLPEAVAVMDLADPAFQNNRALASAVVPILKADGRGLLTWDAGLNAADQVARREDLEAAVIFRDLGTAGTDKVAIRRLLDRAVFKAGQDGRVSVVGEADPETVAALLEWSIEGKAATVALAPVTAVLKID